MGETSPTAVITGRLDSLVASPLRRILGRFRGVALEGIIVADGASEFALRSEAAAAVLLDEPIAASSSALSLLERPAPLPAVERLGRVGGSCRRLPRHHPASAWRVRARRRLFARVDAHKRRQTVSMPCGCHNVRSAWGVVSLRRVVTVGVLILTTALALTSAAAAHAPYLGESWGLNLSGQLGDGTSQGPEECFGSSACSVAAVQVTGLSEGEGVASVAGGEEHTLAALSNGAVWAWGNNEEGQLGDGSTAEAQAESDVPVPVLCCATKVAAGARHSLALLSNSNKEVLAWGDDESGQLGDARSPERHPRSDVPVFVRESRETIKGVIDIAAGEEHSLALLSTGEVRAWGNGESGQLGDENLANKKEAVPVRKLKDTTTSVATSIAAGEEHSLALLSDGTVMAWGSNSAGQLGDGTTTGPDQCSYGPCSKLPVAVAGLRGVVAIAAGGNHSLALLSNHTVMAWGENTFGQLGDGTTTDSNVPVLVSGLTGVVAIAAGEEHSLALLSNGTVVAWGADGEGQLGIGTPVGPEMCHLLTEEEFCSTKPVSVAGLTYTDVKGIAGGGWHSLAFGPPNPTVTSVSPREGFEQGGTVVTISGTELNGATTVRFGGANATAFHIDSNTSITAVSPKGEGTVDVTVTTPEGTSPITSADVFSYSSPVSVVPVVARVSPKEGSQLGGATVTITGAKFTGTTAVKFGSATAPSFTVSNEGTSITAVSPPGTGVVDVAVATAGGRSPTTPADQFSYLAPPTVARVEPNHGSGTGGDRVTISGANFTHATAVKFGTKEAQFLVKSDNQIEALSPTSIQLLGSTETVDVTVTTPGGESAPVEADHFTYSAGGVSSAKTLSARTSEQGPGIGARPLAALTHLSARVQTRRALRIRRRYRRARERPT